jgi:hypothetical protein
MSGNVNVFTATATDNTGSAFKSVQNNIKRTKQESEKLNGSLRIMRGGFGQLGHQVQDVAVQLQMGQNPLMVLTQQGAQVASLFGPTGAIIGAVGAVAGALAGALIPKLMESGKEVDKLHEQVKDLSRLMKRDAKTGAVEYAGALAEVMEVSAAAAENMRMRAVDEATSRFSELREELSNTVKSFGDISTAGVAYSGTVIESHQLLGLQKDDYDRLSESLKSLDMTTHSGREAVMEMLNELQKSQREAGGVDERFRGLTDRFQSAHVEMSTLQRELKYFSQAGAPAVKAATDDMTSSFDSFIEKLTRSVQKAEGLTPAQMLGIQLQNMEGLTQAEKDLAAALVRRLRLQEIADQKGKDAIQAQKDAKSAERARMKREEEMLRQVGLEIDGPGPDKERLKTEKKLESMRTGFLSELELISQQESQRLTFVQGLDESFFDATRTREDMITMIERDSALQRMRIAEEEQEKKQKIAEAGQQVVLQGLQMMASSFAEGTAAQKTAFLAYKSFAAAEAVISAELAAAKMLAMGVGIFGLGAIPASNLVRGMGYASAAIIMAQAVASFEGGGFTGRGARSGGLDGKGGFLGMLHPNERITDMHNGGGSGITIINNVDATGAGPEVDQKIRTAMEKTSRTTIQTVRDLAGRGRLV